MKKLLFITPELPFPAQSGGKVKSMKLLEALAEKYVVTLACPLKLDDADHLEDFYQGSPCKDHIHQPVAVGRTAGNLARSYARGVPLNVLRSFDKTLQREIASVADDHDVVVLDHYEVYPYLPESFKGLTIYHAHNAYYKMWERYAQLPGNPLMRAAAGLEARRVLHAEAGVASKADVVFAAPNDAAELIKAGVPEGKLHDTFHLGDDKQLALPELHFENTQKKLMYVGFLGWEANVQGLLWFIDNVWPRLLLTEPDLEFDIVGKNPDKRLQNAAAAHAGITLRGYVADLQTVYRDSRVSVAPLLFGSGMKVKVLDAMARGMPTVTTSVGAEGIELTQGKHLLVADKPGEMADSINALLTDPWLWQRLQENSRQLIQERYTWRQLFNKMHAVIDRELRDNRVSATQPSGSRLQHAS